MPTTYKLHRFTNTDSANGIPLVGQIASGDISPREDAFPSRVKEFRILGIREFVALGAEEIPSSEVIYAWVGSRPTPFHEIDEVDSGELDSAGVLGVRQDDVIFSWRLATAGTLSFNGWLLYVQPSGDRIFLGKPYLRIGSGNPSTGSNSTASVPETIPDQELAPGEELVWGASEGASLYNLEIYSGDSCLGDPIHVATSDRPAFTLPLLPCGLYSYRVKAIGDLAPHQDSDWSRCQPFHVTLSLALDDTLPDSVVGASYSGAILASGGTPPYTFEVSAGNLPTGLTLSPSGTLTGSPTSADTFNFTVTATDSQGCTGSREYSVFIGSADTCTSCFPTDDEYSYFCNNCHNASLGGNCSFNSPSAPCWLLTITGLTGEHAPANGLCMLSRIGDCLWRGLCRGYQFDLTRPDCTHWRLTATGTSSFSVDIYTGSAHCWFWVSTGFGGGLVQIDPCEATCDTGILPSTILVANTPVTQFRAGNYYGTYGYELISRTKCEGTSASLYGCSADNPFQAMTVAQWQSNCNGREVHPWGRILYSQGGCYYSTPNDSACTSGFPCDWGGYAVTGAELGLFRTRRIWVLTFRVAFFSCPESIDARLCFGSHVHFPSYYKIWTPSDQSPLGTYKAWCPDTLPATMVLS